MSRFAKYEMFKTNPINDLSVAGLDITDMVAGCSPISKRVEILRNELHYPDPVSLTLYNAESQAYNRKLYQVAGTGEPLFGTYLRQTVDDYRFLKLSHNHGGNYYTRFVGQVVAPETPGGFRVDHVDHRVTVQIRDVFWQMSTTRVRDHLDLFKLHAWNSATRLQQSMSGTVMDIVSACFKATGLTSVTLTTDSADKYFSRTINGKAYTLNQVFVISPKHRTENIAEMSLGKLLSELCIYFQAFVDFDYDNNTVRCAFLRKRIPGRVPRMTVRSADIANSLTIEPYTHKRAQFVVTVARGSMLNNTTVEDESSYNATRFPDGLKYFTRYDVNIGYRANQKNNAFIVEGITTQTLQVGDVFRLADVATEHTIQRVVTGAAYVVYQIQPRLSRSLNPVEKVILIDTTDTSEETTINLLDSLFVKLDHPHLITASKDDGKVSFWKHQYVTGAWDEYGLVKFFDFSPSAVVGASFTDIMHARSTAHNLKSAAFAVARDTFIELYVGGRYDPTPIKIWQESGGHAQDGGQIVGATILEPGDSTHALIWLFRRTNSIKGLNVVRYDLDEHEATKQLDPEAYTTADEFDEDRLTRTGFVGSASIRFYGLCFNGDVLVPEADEIIYFAEGNSQWNRIWMVDTAEGYLIQDRPFRLRNDMSPDASQSVYVLQSVSTVRWEAIAIHAGASGSTQPDVYIARWNVAANTTDVLKNGITNAHILFSVDFRITGLKVGYDRKIFFTATNDRIAVYDQNTSTITNIKTSSTGTGNRNPVGIDIEEFIAAWEIVNDGKTRLETFADVTSQLQQETYKVDSRAIRFGLKKPSIELFMGDAMAIDSTEVVASSGNTVGLIAEKILDPMTGDLSLVLEEVEAA